MGQLFADHNSIVNTAAPEEPPRFEWVMNTEIKPTLERLELVFMNPAENRWQIFQEYGQEKEKEKERRTGANYRWHAQEILGSVRKWLLFSEIFEEKQADHVEIVCLKFNQMKIDIKNYCNRGGGCEYKNIVEREIGLIEKSAVSQLIEFNELKTKLMDVMKEDARHDEIHISRKQALDLISLLQIDRSWDIFGALSPLKMSEATFSPAKVKFFVYKISLPGGEPRNDVEKMLSYSVDLDIIKTTKENPDKHQFHMFGKSQYKAKTISNYCFYAALIKVINEGMVHTSKDKSTVICWPIRICGYDHFLQAHIVNPPDSPPHLESVMKLADDLGSSGNGIHARLFKECVRELLVQMHIAAFQFHASQKATPKTVKQNAPYQINANKLGELFCLNAPNLVRMTTARYCVENGPKVQFCYCDSMTWRRSNLKKCVECSDIFDNHEVHVTKIDTVCAGKQLNIEVHVPWESEFDGHISHLFAMTGRQRMQALLDELRDKVEFRNDGIGQITPLIQSLSKLI